MPMIDIKLEGAAFFEKQLLSLERKVAKKIIRKAVRAGAKVVLPVTKSAARSMVGGDMGALISKNLIARAFRKQRRGQFGMSIRTRGDVAELVDGQAFIPFAIEFGHVDRAGGFVPAIPFMRSSFDATRFKATREISKTLTKEILIAVKTK